jgi:hypothetical protein
MRGVDKNNRRANDKSPGGDRALLSVHHRSMGSPGAHSGLLFLGRWGGLRGFLYGVFLRPNETGKHQPRANGEGRSESVSDRL